MAYQIPETVDRIEALRFDVGQNGLERRQVAVDVADDRGPHGCSSGCEGVSDLCIDLLMRHGNVVGLRRK